VRESLRRLLERALDDAAILTPGNHLGDLPITWLSLEQADSWNTLGKMVCPAARIVELDTALHVFSGPLDNVDVLVLGEVAPNSAAAAESLARDLDRIDQASDAGRLNPVGFVYSVPEHGDLQPAIRAAARKAAGLDKRGMLLSVNIPVGENGIDTMHGFAESVDNIAFVASIENCSSAHLAAFISETINLDSMLRFDAGASPGISTSDGVGFVNAAMAGALADAEDLTRKEIETVLNEVDHAAFRFADDGASWRGCPLSIPELDAYRVLLDGMSFKRVEDAWQHLRRLGWL